MPGCAQPEDRSGRPPFEPRRPNTAIRLATSPPQVEGPVNEGPPRPAYSPDGKTVLTGSLTNGCHGTRSRRAHLNAALA
jgi:hypothetical protein